jgi:5-deoxy-glucuronate isomerase
MNDDVTIHSAKLPATIPMADLLLRPTDGLTIGADPHRAGWRYLSFRSLGLASGQTATFANPDQEAIVVTIGGGGIRIEFESHPAFVLEGRANVFAGLGARVAGLPVKPYDRAIIAYGQAPASGRSGVSKTPILIRPDDVEVEIRGAGHATRQVNNLVMPDFPADRLLCCEVFTPGGNWSGWPPHKHDIDAMPNEAVLEETYYYQISRPEGWGVARLYFHDGRPDAFWAVRTGDLLLVTEGYHPFAANQGYDAYYLNFLAGDRRTMQASDDPDIAWVRSLWPTMEKDPRLPLVARVVAA